MSTNPDDAPFEHFTDLDDTLAVGCHPQTPEQIAWLAKTSGIRGVVNLQSDADLETRRIRWGNLWQLYTRHGIAVTRVPVTDFDKRDLGRNLQAAVDAVAGYVGEGRKVYVHCNAGINRSPSTVIAYLVAHRGMSLDEANAWLSERHRCIPYPDVLKRWHKRLLKQLRR